MVILILHRNVHTHNCPSVQRKASFPTLPSVLVYQFRPSMRLVKTQGKSPVDLFFPFPSPTLVLVYSGISCCSVSVAVCFVECVKEEAFQKGLIILLDTLERALVDYIESLLPTMIESAILTIT